MNPLEIVYGIVAGLALIAGIFVEWRRGDQSERIACLEQRLTAVEARTDCSERLTIVEASLERLRRNL